MDNSIEVDGVTSLNGASAAGDIVAPAPKRTKTRGRVTRSLNVTVIGTGYVGLVTGAVLADQGANVTCVDNNPAKLEVIERGESPIYEPGLDRVIQSGLRSGRLHTESDAGKSVETADVVFIAVGTPPAEDGSPDLTAVFDVVREIAPRIKQHITLVTKSTVPVGTGDVIENLLEEMAVNMDLVDVVSNPEFLREGSAVFDSLYPERVVIGVNRPNAEMKLLEMYGRAGCPILVTDRASAEMIKYASNSFLALKISYINAISRICEKVGADVADVAKGMGLDSRIGKQFLNAGLGWGGSCFPKDVQGLIHCARENDYVFTMLESAQQVNDEQVTHFVARLEHELGGFKGKSIALLGLAFKPNTDDIRDAKSIDIINALLQGGAHIKAYDPVAMKNMQALFPALDYKSSAADTLVDADAAVVVTEWEEFQWINWNDASRTMRGNIVFDGRRIYPRCDVEKAGLQYFTIGA